MEELANIPDDHAAGLFDEIKQVNEHGSAYWPGRDLMSQLDYKNWSNFKHAIERAKTSCGESGNDPTNHFVDVNKMVATGSGAKRQIADIALSRFACYLIAQNGDPGKPAIAAAQKYFAIQTRRQEFNDSIAADLERVEKRDKCSSEFRDLSGVAKQAGVNSKRFGIFHDAGYKGMYNGRGSAAIRAKKGIPQDSNLLDHMDTQELWANGFRFSQAKEQVALHAQSEQDAIRINERVGREVRAAISRIGGTMPEDLPAVEHIKFPKKRIEQAKSKIELPVEEAKGLAPQGLDDI